MIEIFDFETRPLTFEDVSKLFKESFNKELKKDYWEWRFLENPAREKNVFITYALDNDKVVAYYAVSPVDLVDKNKSKRRAALSNMTMTHPDYQGKGLFKTLANQMFNILRDRGFVGVFGFANSNSHYGFRKNLGWKDISILNVFSVSKDEFRGFLLKTDEELTYESKPIDSINGNHLCDEYQNTEGTLIHVDFNKEYFKWRLTNNPEQSYKAIQLQRGKEVLAILVYKKYGSGLDIMEYWFSPSGAANKEIHLVGIINFLLEEEGNNINLWSNLHSKEHLILEKFGFKEQAFNSYFGFVPFTDEKDFLSVENWHYRFTDSDIF